MSPHFLSAAMVISAIAMYQICMKTIPDGVNPASALITFYVSALVFTIIAAKLFMPNEAIFSADEFSWAAALVGIAIVGIELGYLLMYRSGWSLAAAPLIGMGGSAIILIIVSFIFFKEPVSLRTLSGVGLCLIGLFLLTPQD